MLEVRWLRKKKRINEIDGLQLKYSPKTIP